MWLFCLCVIQKYTKFEKFARLYRISLILQFFAIKDAFSSYGDEFRSSCLDQNFVYIAGMVFKFLRFKITFYKPVEAETTVVGRVPV